MSEMDKGQRGITLAGMLVLVLILVGAFFLLRPIYLKFSQGSRVAACSYNLHKIGDALQHYANDFDDIVPPAQWCYGPAEAETVRWSQALAQYVSIRDRNTVFHCPGKSSASDGYAVNYLTFHTNHNTKAEKQNYISNKQVHNPGETIYALDTGFITEQTKDSTDPLQWKEQAEGVRDLCRCSNDPKTEPFWSKDPARPMPRHQGKVNCLMLDGSVKDYIVNDIVTPKKGTKACLWDAE